LVDVFDGYLDMWETAHHLHVLEALEVAAPSPVDAGSGTSRDHLFYMPYRLNGRNASDGA
jgi:hypothetical protein